MSLKEILLHELKNRRHLPYDEMTSICRTYQKKASNGEKRFRDLRSKYLQGKLNPDYDEKIGDIRNPRGAIIAYTYGLQQVKVKQVENPDWCNFCGSWITHDPNCTEVKEKTNQLF